MCGFRRCEGVRGSRPWPGRVGEETPLGSASQAILRADCVGGYQSPEPFRPARWAAGPLPPARIARSDCAPGSWTRHLSEPNPPARSVCRRLWPTSPATCGFFSSLRGDTRPQGRATAPPPLVISRGRLSESCPKKEPRPPRRCPAGAWRMRPPSLRAPPVRLPARTGACCPC